MSFVDLNTATAEMLRNIGLRRDLQLIKAREKRFFKGNPLTAMKSVLGEERFNRYNEVLNFDVYDHTKSDVVRDYEKQSVVLWPEDLSKLK